ncbi:galactosyltransferase-related protein [Flavobacterium sp.]|uniref:glycosyltransferase family 2 protein n=1 Tax=Flavobacterium sp. TaxID=239 RepID=UPI0025B9B415|nr:galactosyltransferase-related protein [Flavobacterium sp.]
MIKSMLDQLGSTGNAGKIGVAITEYNRYDVFKKSYAEIKRLLPPDAAFEVVDDGSDKPFPEATFRFEKNRGIAAAKNKCLELLYLQGCEHFFLFDSDTHPLAENWFVPYMESKEPHLNYIFQDFATGKKLNDCKEIYRDSEKVAYSHVRGCMLYFKRVCLEKVGGMDTVFGKWGHEHPNLSDRIYMAGLTSFRYMDVPNSKGLIYSGDEHETVKTTVAGAERKAMLAQNNPIFEANRFDKSFKPFIEKKNAILTCYFTGVVDPQRKEKWVAKASDLDALIASASKSSVELVVLHDCFSDEDERDVPGLVRFVRVETSVNPYAQRWISYRNWLRENAELYEHIICVDATDVEVLREPEWANIGERLIVGDEVQVVGCDWMVKKHQGKTLQDFFKANAQRQLINAGVMGGKVSTVLEFMRQLIDFYCLDQMGETDMGMFNYIAYSNWNERLFFGRQITTVFKAEDKNDKIAWFKHK